MDSTGSERDEPFQFPQEVPVLPLRDLVVFPFMVVPLFVSRKISIAAVDEALLRDRLLLLCAQKNGDAESPKSADLHDLGSIAKILRVRRLPDGQIKLLVQGISRAHIERLLSEHPSILVAPGPVPDVAGETGPALEALFRTVRESLHRLSEIGKGLPQDLMNVLSSLSEPGPLADLVAAHLGLSVPDAQSILQASSVFARLHRVNELLTKEVEVLTWQQKIQTQAKEEISRAQREYFLREQLKQIRQELGDFDDKHDEVTEFSARIQSAGLPPECEREAQKQLRRLEQLHADAAEAGVIRTYLDWLADLPWSKMTTDRLNLDRAHGILDEDHFGLEKIKERILEYLGVLKLSPDHKGPILCFVGPPGVGKTSLGRSIARALGREFVRVSLGGVRDEAEIRGHRRTYVGSMPGRIISGIKQAGSKNPVFVLDEIDKVGMDARGDPASALLEVLDPEQNHAFRDHYLNLPFDLSRVLWVATANVADPIPPALRDRMELIQIHGYDFEEKLEIARRFLLPRQKRQTGLRENSVAISDAALERVIEGYTREAGLRGLSQQLGAITRKIAREFAEGRKRPVRLESKHLEKYLGPRKHDPDRPDEVDRVGLATGLAWSQAGGMILHVEATAIPGKEGLTLTGHLGSVMKESVQAAYSCARVRAQTYGISRSRFHQHEFHIHVPHGAIPKDGPSAGLAMITAIMSLFLDAPVRRDVAMTGEITLRGRVLPVGGLREKMLAAARVGIRNVIIPEGNQAELSELPPKLLTKLRIHVVSDVEEALRISVLGFRPPKQPKRSLSRSTPRFSV